MAAWLHHRMTARGEITEVVTAEDLCVDANWRHSVGPTGTGCDVILADGRRLCNGEIRWVLNRLVKIPDACLLRAEEGDRHYAEQEWRALLSSALLSLHLSGVAVVEPPDPYFLCGRWLSPAKWAVLAAGAGLAVRPWRWHESLPEWQPVGDAVASVLVVGKIVLSNPPLPEALMTACGRLAVLAQKSLLHVGLTLEKDAQATFCGVAPLADPRIAGEPAVDALLTLLHA